MYRSRRPEQMSKRHLTRKKQRGTSKKIRTVKRGGSKLKGSSIKFEKEKKTWTQKDFRTGKKKTR